MEIEMCTWKKSNGQADISWVLSKLSQRVSESELQFVRRFLHGSIISVEGD